MNRRRTILMICICPVLFVGQWAYGQGSDPSTGSSHIVNATQASDIPETTSTSNSVTDSKSRISEELKITLVEHLSAEIVSLTEFQTSHRVNMSFSVLVGPFIVLGTFLMATRGKLSNTIKGHSSIWYAVGVAVIVYIGFACYGAAIERMTLDRSNSLRLDIARIWDGGLPDKNNVEHEVILITYYLSGAGLLLGVFLPITWICYVLTSKPSTPPKSPQP
jgi:hypothetical protein